MNKRLSYIFIYCLVLSLYGCFNRSGLPDLTETYSYRDTKPFGGYIAKKILDQMYAGNYVQVLKESFEGTSAIYSDTSSVYFSLSRNLFADEAGVDALLGYVYNGNTAFFASSDFDTVLLNKLFCMVSDQVYFDSLYGLLRPTSVKLVADVSSTKDSFSYFYEPFSSYFSEVNDRYCRTVGYNADGKANCIVFFWGKGKLFLHTDPHAFSNYFLLKDNNYKYMQDIVNVLNPSPQHVYWDDYYIKKNGRGNQSGSHSSLSEIFRHPPLQAAFWLLLLMLLLYVLFGSKRKQRIIREIKTNQNSSVAFTETVARLYLQQHDNKNIADKMITYFYEFIRSNYFLNATTGSREFVIALSKKSGIPEERTIALFNAINHANENTTIDDYQLLSLNEQIQQFYKKRK